MPEKVTHLTCPICGPEARSRKIHPARLGDENYDFAARKTPEHLHFDINECSSCGLIYSSPIIEASDILELYRNSRFIAEAQLENMVADYLAEFEKARQLTRPINDLLEIGCSSGFFLEAAKAHGIANVVGVEPGEEACSLAPGSIRPNIYNGFFEKDMFERESFDMVCCFQVLDHLLDPLSVLEESHRLLRPGGTFLTVNHNIRSWMPRLLGRKCPMYDIEHMFLFDPRTMQLIMEKSGFDLVHNANLPNSYSLEYAFKMFPLPKVIRNTALSFISKLNVNQWKLRIPAGNMITIGRKPGA